MKRKTNVEFVTSIMEHSNYGAVKQAFIISALDEYSRQVLEDKIDMDEHSIIPPNLWQSIAQEVTNELIEQYGKQS